MSSTASRPLQASLGPITRADGSALFSCGATTVLCGVYGPAEVRAHRELIDRASTDVVFRPKVGPSGAGDRAVEAFLRGPVKCCLLASQHPRAAVHLSVQELEDRGGRLAACANALCLSMMDAALPMRSLFAGLTVCVLQDGVVSLDHQREMDESTVAVVTFVLESTQKQVVASHVKGKCSEKKFQECLSAAMKGVDIVFHFYRECLSRKFSKELGHDTTEDMT